MSEMVYGIVDFHRGQVCVNQLGEFDRGTAWRLIRQIIPSLPAYPCEEHALTLRREVAECGTLLWEGSVRGVDPADFGLGGAGGYEPPMVHRKVYQCEYTQLVSYRAEKARREEEEREAEYARRERERAEEKEASRRFLLSLPLPAGAEVTDHEGSLTWSVFFIALPGGVKVFQDGDGERLSVAVRGPHAFDIEVSDLALLAPWALTLPEVNPDDWWVKLTWERAKAA